MPPDFEQMLRSAKARLAKAIEGRESSDAPVAPDASSRQIVLRLGKVPINTSAGMYDYAFAIHADCPCSSIAEFLSKVTLENITFAKGPRKGDVLGIDGKAIAGFYAYRK